MQRKNGMLLPGSGNKRVLILTCVNICVQVVSCSDESRNGTGSAAPDWRTSTVGYVEPVTVCGQRNASLCVDSGLETE